MLKINIKKALISFLKFTKSEGVNHVVESEYTITFSKPKADKAKK